MMNRTAEIASAFETRFGAPPEHIVRAPGRVNLIGEHTDYNDGWVLPMAIDREVLIAARRRQDTRVYMVALDRRNATSEFAPDSIPRDNQNTWSNYIRGVASLLALHNLRFPGLDMMIAGNVPIGSGLSSSAALLVAAAVTFQTFGGFALDRVRLAKLAQQAENEFTGVKSGIMDQFISALAQAGTALLIDCRDLKYEHVPLPHDCEVIMCDTGKRRALSNSAYNTRRAECEEAVRWLAEKWGEPLRALRDVDYDRFVTVETAMPALLAKRARHVLTENRRVHAAVRAARANDPATLGQLMNQSHESLRDSYQVSSPELDEMVASAQAEEGVYGARLTGAGFGGCTVNLVRPGETDVLAKKIALGYQARTGLLPSTFIVKASDGAGIVY